MVRILVLTGLLLGAAFVVACGGDDDDETAPAADGAPVSAVTVNLTNWEMEPSSGVLKAGKVTFAATHVEEHGGHGASEGGETHQLFVARLPDGKKGGKGDFGSPVLNLSEIKMGETKTGDAALEPGTYELACLVVEQVNGKSVNHYEKGMYTTVTVE